MHLFTREKESKGGSEERERECVVLCSVLSRDSEHTYVVSWLCVTAGVMAASLGFPFTSAQWRELERQAMIYKYMMASVPVPPDLLIPTSLTSSSRSSCSMTLCFLVRVNY